jgi:epoxyqueuosine reductase
MGIFKGEMVDAEYQPSFLYKLLRPRRSGNTINGLGETERRRPTPVYHRYDFWHPWILFGASFIIKKLLTPEHRKYFKRMSDMDKQGFVPIAPTRAEDTPENWTRRAKEIAVAQPGCDVVGVAKLDPEWVFDKDTITTPWVIVLGLQMDYKQLANNLEGRSVEGEVAVFDAYLDSQEAAFRTADWIREQGFEAKGVGGPKGSELNNIPAGIAAGLGQLGKHGSLMNDELGACFRMSYVLTDLPLVADAPKDIGVDDFCVNCQLCTKHCPPQAIYPDKQLVRGVDKWYVDFDKCVSYFNDYDGCGICISMLKNRERRAVGEES